MADLDRSIFFRYMLFSAPHQYTHTYSGSKNDIKSANAVHCTYNYIVVCITWNKLYLVGCIRGLSRKLIMKRQWFHLNIHASPAYIWCMIGHMANGSETPLMTINDMRAQYFIQIHTLYPYVRNVLVFGQCEMTEMIIWQLTKTHKSCSCILCRLWKFE